VRSLGVIAFLAGLLLGVRVMFFGVRRTLSNDQIAFRRWPFALAAFLVVFGAMTYARGAGTNGSTATGVATAVTAGVVAAFLAWWVVRRSELVPSTDPEDDPEFRFQGQVARVVEPIQLANGQMISGRIAFEFDGRRYEFRARWTPGDWAPALGRTDSEVVIERIDGDVAYVEPWVAIEERL